MLSRWIPSRPEEGHPFHEAFDRIELQKHCGRAAFSGYAYDVPPIEPEVL